MANGGQYETPEEGQPLSTNDAKLVWSKPTIRTLTLAFTETGSGIPRFIDRDESQAAQYPSRGGYRADS